MIPELHENTILRVEVGSTAHGTGQTGMEDHDETVVQVETKEQVFGLNEGFRNKMYRTQPEGTQSGPGDTDRQVYSLRSFLKLAASGNPSIMLVLWAPVLQANHVGLHLREIAPAFVSRQMIPRYRGYMQSQAMRLLGTKGGGHGKRGGGGRPELIEAYGYDTKYAMHCARLGFQCLELLKFGKLRLPIPGEIGGWLKDLRHGKVPFEHWWEETLHLDASLADWLDNESIPAAPDRRRIEEFSVWAHESTWNANRQTQMHVDVYRAWEEHVS